VVPALKTLLRTAIENKNLRDELEIANQKLQTITMLDQMVGSSEPMLALHSLIRKVASLDASVLITGESGTGKELMARAIHNLGKRSKRPFLAVSCAAIPEALIESELFGHEKGAFTGTAGTREGYFEQVGDGTLFLDEIGELKLSTQVKLLRVLQERQFSRLGSGRSIPLKARVVLATHRDLNKMVADGEFRQDLYYRISVMDIKAPALRYRSSDIPMLANHFMRKYSEVFGTPIDRIAPEAMALLQGYSWPGNIRELENVIQRALIVADGHSIEAADLPEAVHDSQLCEADLEVQPNGSFENLVRAYKTKLAINAVRENGGNKTLASQSLSISRAYLHRLIRQELPEASDDLLTAGKPDLESVVPSTNLVC
jgi:DNA-binding NtrC family response regulator